MRAKTPKKISNFPLRVPTSKLRAYQAAAKEQGRSLTKQIEVVMDGYLVSRKEAAEARR